MVCNGVLFALTVRRPPVPCCPDDAPTVNAVPLPTEEGGNEEERRAQESALCGLVGNEAGDCWLPPNVNPDDPPLGAGKLPNPPPLLLEGGAAMLAKENPEPAPAPPLLLLPPLNVKVGGAMALVVVLVAALPNGAIPLVEPKLNAGAAGLLLEGAAGAPGEKLNVGAAAEDDAGAGAAGLGEVGNDGKPAAAKTELEDEAGAAEKPNVCVACDDKKVRAHRLPTTTTRARGQRRWRSCRRSPRRRGSRWSHWWPRCSMRTLRRSG